MDRFKILRFAEDYIPCHAPKLTPDELKQQIISDYIKGASSRMAISSSLIQPFSTGHDFFNAEYQVYTTPSISVDTIMDLMNHE